jgi:myosin-crossreactive antigen
MQSEAVPSSRAAYSNRTSALMALFCELAHDGKLSLESARNTFRYPSVFSGHIDESSFTLFTGTQKNRRFFDLMERFSRQEPGRNGITSLPESSWSLTFIINHQPYYQNQPAGVYVF